MNDNNEIPAIHDDDLKRILIDNDLIDKIGTGQIKCSCCQVYISWDNLYGIFFKDNTIHFICDSTDCIDELRKND